MNNEDDKQLADAWIQLQRLPQESAQTKDWMWAAVQLDKLTLGNPPRCWSVVLEIFRTTDDEWVLTNLACGPIESLLALHGATAIGWIESEAKADPRFRAILRDVWQNTMTDEIWNRLRRAAAV